MTDTTIHVGNALDVMRTLPTDTYDVCITSPPYWGLREYGNLDQQIGLEKTPEAYVTALVPVFHEVKRVLKPRGTLWLNIGDSYAPDHAQRRFSKKNTGVSGNHGLDKGTIGSLARDKRGPPPGTKPKDMIGVPWMLAFALRADGWWLRSEIIWSKPNPKPENPPDRPSKAHEQIFLLAPSKYYQFNKDGLREPSVTKPGKTRNPRTIWHIPVRAFKGAHFAVMTPEIAKRCLIGSGAGVGGRVLDPFGGAGTTALVAMQAGLSADIIELNPDYAELARKRLTQEGFSCKRGSKQC